METLGIALAAIVIYLAIWTYFDACRQRDSLQIGVGPRNLAPEAWSALTFFFSVVALPLYLKAREEAELQASPRSGAPPVFESRGLNVFGWCGLLLFLGLAGYLAWEREFLFAALAVLPALVAVFGGRTIRGTDRTLKVELPKAAAWEQVGFRPLPQEEDQDEDADDDRIVNLDRLPPAPTRPGFGAASAPPPTPAFPAVPQFAPVAAPVPAAPALNVPSVSSYPAARPEPSPAASPASPSVLRISDITWAASEDDFDDGSSGPPPAPGSRPQGAVVNADPALFQQLGGIFAPPGSSPPPRLPATPPPPAAQPGRALGPPAPNPLPTAPKAPTGPAGRPGAPAAPPLTPRLAPPPIAGAYAASKSANSPLPWILVGALALVGIVVAWFWWQSRPAPVPAPETEPPAAENTDTRKDTQDTSVDSPNAEFRGQESGPALDNIHAWMALYIEIMGPVGQNLDIVDFEGFSPDRCELLEQSLGPVADLPACPDEQIEFKLRSCLISLPYLAEACHNQDVYSWCGHLTQTRFCLNEAQIDIEERWGLPGLVEFTFDEGEPRPESSISGRCAADTVEQRSQEVDAARDPS